MASGQAGRAGTQPALARALDAVGAKWTLLIVDVLLRAGACRFKDLTDNLEGISTNLLSERLRELEHAGVIRRDVSEPPGSVVTYALTTVGHDLAPVVDALAAWGDALGRGRSAPRAVPSRSR